MDQQAFRQLISTPRHDDSNRGSSSQQRSFGKQNKAVAKESPLRSADLLPRKVGGGGSKKASTSSLSSKEPKQPIINSATGETYVDRAEARRLNVDGTSNDNDTEALRQDLEQKLEEAKNEDEREKLQKQLMQLGGDSGKRPTIRKGLDLDLLAQQKAKLSGTVNGKEIDDDDLEQAYGSGGIAPGSDEEEKIEKSVVPASKFRPIGSNVGTKKEDESQPEYIWRDGKRMRKKKKKPAVAEGADTVGDRSTDISLLPAEVKRHSNKEGGESRRRVSDIDQQSPEKKIVALQSKEDRERREMPPPRLIPPAGPDTIADIKEDVSFVPAQEANRVEEASIDSEDDSTDIFADAGRWNGFDDDDEEEEGEAAEATIVAPVSDSSSSGKRDWFSSGREIGGEQGGEGAEEVALPSSLTSIIDTAHEAKKTQEAKEKKTSSPDSEDEEGEAKPERLEGFSDSILGREGVRYMLEKKDDDRNGQQRKRKRSKKGKGGYGSD